jgi:hypothetical protein
LENQNKDKQANREEELAILTESGSGSDNIKLSIKREKISGIQSNKCHRNNAIDRRIKAESVSKGPKNQEIREKEKSKIKF